MLPEGWLIRFSLDVLLATAISLGVLALVYYLHKRHRVGLWWLALLLILGCVLSVFVGTALGLSGSGGVGSILVIGGMMLGRFYRGTE